MVLNMDIGIPCKFKKFLNFFKISYMIKLFCISLLVF